MASVVTLEAIQRITQLTEGGPRNRQITYCYHSLSQDLARVMDSRNSNWATFATWASKTAGESINNEEVPQFLLELLEREYQLQGAVTRFVRSVIGIKVSAGLDVIDDVRQTLKEVSTQVAEGNLRVFAELAPLFARFIELIDTGADAGLGRFFDELRPGPADADGQDLLRAAFGNYLAAVNTGSSKHRAELILLGNCRIGLHEQTRLQANIRGALDAPVRELFLERVQGRLPVELPFDFHGFVRRELGELAERVQRSWEDVATRYAMNLSLPNGNEIALGRDIPPTFASMFPAELTVLENEELVTLLRGFDVNLDSLVGSAAHNWAVLEQRMRFIVDLFRSRQQESALFGAPFTEPWTL